MTNPTKQVKEWYNKNAERLAANFPKADFFEQDEDPVRGGVTIELEGPTLVATLTFWYKGDVSVEILKKGSERPLYLEDRTLLPGEDVCALLDSCLRDIENLV